MKHKSEVKHHLQGFIKLVQTQFNKTIKIVRSDNGTKFLLHNLYHEYGIQRQTSCGQTPQQNGQVERRHQQILNVARGLLFQAKLPKTFWGLAAAHAVFLINRISSPLLNNKSPYELLYQAKPDLTSLKVFGCLSYCSTLTSQRSKFDLRSHKCVFVGYKTGTKGFLL